MGLMLNAWASVGMERLPKLAVVASTAELNSTLILTVLIPRSNWIIGRTYVHSSALTKLEYWVIAQT